MSSTERFSHGGLSCKIIQMDAGHWCGYVQISDDLGPVRWTHDYDPNSDYDSKRDKILEPEVDVWGGVTYGPDSDGWVGFDTSYGRSLVNNREQNNDKSAVKEETKRLAEQIVQLDTEADPSTGESTDE